MWYFALLFACLFMNACIAWNEPINSRQVSSNTFKKAGNVAAASLSFFGLIERSKATTFFDTDVYGDKELKIATVNKLKQKLRNAILADPSIASGFLKLSVNDALGYNIVNRDGGADGSLLFEMDRDCNKDLASALKVLQTVQKDLQRTNTLSFADVCAFGGSEALESMGCGRVVVQIGRYDSKKANAKESAVSWSSPSSDSIVSAFQESGLQVKDALVLLSSIGEVDRVVSATQAASQKKKEDDEDEDDLFEPEPFVPTTFGARDDIFGSKVGKGDFGTVYLTTILKGKAASDDKLAQVILAQANGKAILSKYVGNDLAYRKDVADIYAKLTQIGESYTTRNS